MGNQTLMDPIDFYGGKNTMEVNGAHQPFGYRDSSKISYFVFKRRKYLILCSKEEIHTGLEQLDGD